MGRRSVLVALLVVSMAVAGCLATSTSSSSIGHLAGPSLDPFGVRVRCEQGGDCNERAMEAFEAALERLGPEILGTPITTNGGAPPDDRLYVEITSDPPLAWRSEAGQEGTSAGFRIDLTDGDPYVVVAPQLAFRLSDQDAAAIRDALFVER